jgi:hypothetical protein
MTMKKSDGSVDLAARWRVTLFAFLLAAVAFVAWPTAQSVWSDVSHEVTLRNDPQSFTCSVVNSNATILTAFTGSCIGSAATVGQSLYITDITASASAIATTSADSFLELKSGTGGTCATNTAVVWSAYNLAFAPVVATFTTPIKVGANVDLCWMDAVTGSKTFIVNGYIK